jgi:hypothetical protein
MMAYAKLMLPLKPDSPAESRSRINAAFHHPMVGRKLHGFGADLWRATSTSISPR